MLTQRNGAALAGHPTRELSRQAEVLPPIIPDRAANVKRLATRDEVEEVLSAMWGHPATTVLCRIGGGASSYYAHDGNGHYCPLDYAPMKGFLILADDTAADHCEYNDTRYAAARGMA